jgi:hypothetical protein
VTAVVAISNAVVFGYALPLSEGEEKDMRKLQLQYIDECRKHWHMLNSAQVTAQYALEDHVKVSRRCVELAQRHAAAIARLKALGESGTPVPLTTPLTTHQTCLCCD